MLCGVNNANTIRYYYDSNGMRTHKSVNGTVTDFCYAGNLLTSQTCGDTTFQKVSLAKRFVRLKRGAPSEMLGLRRMAEARSRNMSCFA